MKGKCYYCNKELTERTIKRHMKNCGEMKKSIEEEKINSKKQRDQFIIAIKPKYAGSEYCIYLSISGMLGLVHIDQFIRDLWVECCGHSSSFGIKGKYYMGNEMNVELNNVLSIYEKFEYEYDFGSTTNLILEVVDIIQVPSSFSQMEIIARNNEIKHECDVCGIEANYFNYEQDRWECPKCIDQDNDMISEFDYCNSPRDGACAYKGYKEAENTYLPGNHKKYKISKRKIKEQDDYENIFDTLISRSSNIINNVFVKGIFSFDIKELINNLSKEDIYDIATCLGMTRISSLNKNKLIEKLLYEYVALIEKKMSLFDEERYKLLKSYINDGGMKFVDKMHEDDIEKMVYFMTNGMLFSSIKDGKPLLLMPEVIQKLVKEKNNIEYRTGIKFNNEIINLYRGMNRVYGILSLTDIKKLFARYGIEESERYRIEAVIKEGQGYYQEYEVESEGTLLVNIDVEDWLELLDKLNEEEKLEHAMIPKEELLCMSDEHWIGKIKYGKAFTREFLSMFNTDEDILFGLIESLYLDVQENDLEDVINDILEQLEEGNREIQDFIYNSVNRFLRSVRLWKYKGATINEKKGNMINKEKQMHVGRNEPCSCGSGKKYKNCCAKDGNVIKLF